MRQARRSSSSIWIASRPSTATRRSSKDRKMWRKKTDKRSPLKDQPLRLPGQSVQDEIARLFDEEFLPYIFTGTFAVFFAALDWLNAISKVPRNPWIMTAICPVIIVYSALRGYRVIQKIKPLKLGRDGERI